MEVNSARLYIIPKFKKQDPQSQKMLTNHHKSDKDQEKLEVVVSDDDSIVVEPQRKQMTTHTEFDIKYEEDEKKIVMFIELDPKNIANLTKDANTGKVYDERRLYKNCIFLRKIQTPESKIKGNFRITYLHYKGLAFIIELKTAAHTQQMGDIADMFSKMKVYSKAQQNWEIRWLNCIEGDQKVQGQFRFEINASDVDKLLKQKLLLQVFFEKAVRPSQSFRGIQNEGNTCYVNSTLQVLYHFLPLRKMIIELPSRALKKLTKSLQQIFVDLMTSESSVRAQCLLNCFEKIDNLPHRQQDIHQFLMGFFDELEKELPQVASFWTGKDYEVIYSKQQQYESKQQQNFTELQLFMADQKGNHFLSISQSLLHLLQEELVDQQIDTDKFGKLTVYKSRFFETLPPLLFMNIKRYEYNAKRRELKKINLDLTYPKILNLDFLMKTQQGLDYVLYAVVVHKGRTPNSGHYFCFVNVSKKVDVPDWYEFNDSTVRKVTEVKVLDSYTGKKKQEIYLNEEYGKWAEREEPSEETAYLLAYIHKDYFEEYQNLEVSVPSWQLQRLQQKITEEQLKTMTPVKMFVLRTEGQFRPFQLSYELQEVKLAKDELLETEFRKLQKMLSCKVGSIWKINCKTRTIKHIHKDYGQECRITVSRHTEQKRGIRQPDYFMVVPVERMGGLEPHQQQKLGILHMEHLSESETVESVEILPKDQILQKLQQLRKDGANIQYDQQEYQYFTFDWNGYLRVLKS